MRKGERKGPQGSKNITLHSLHHTIAPQLQHHQTTLTFCYMSVWRSGETNSLSDTSLLVLRNKSHHCRVEEQIRKGPVLNASC